MLKEISVDMLVPHPENCNVMSSERLEKLIKNIARTHRYEPLLVRPHPREVNKFEIINGHNRLKALKKIGYLSVLCLMWEMTDEQARIYLATLNRLKGEDAPERRAMLIENLLNTFSSDELASLLPDPRQTIRKLEQLADSNSAGCEIGAVPHVELPAPLMLVSFMLEDSESEIVFAALDILRNQSNEQLTPGAAVAQMAQFFLEHVPRNGK